MDNKVGMTKWKSRQKIVFFFKKIMRQNIVDPKAEC